MDIELLELDKGDAKLMQFRTKLYQGIVREIENRNISDREMEEAGLNATWCKVIRKGRDLNKIDTDFLILFAARLGLNIICEVYPTLRTSLLEAPVSEQIGNPYNP